MGRKQMEEGDRKKMKKISFEIEYSKVVIVVHIQ
jgi:hypothetical protein